MAAAPRFPERAKDLTIDEQALELVQEWRFMRLRWIYDIGVTVAEASDEERATWRKSEVYHAMNAVMDEYNGKILPELILINAGLGTRIETESHIELGQE